MKNPDRRTRKTKHTIKQIFLGLLKQKSIEKISVTELCSLADLNRSTFYLHYCDIYALLEEIELDCLTEFDRLAEEISRKSIAPRQVTRMILEYIYGQKDLLSLLLSKNNRHDFWQKINRKVLQLFKIKTLQNYQLPEHMSENEFDDMLLFYASGFYAVFEKWLSEQCTEDIEKVAEKTTLFSQICFDHLLIRGAAEGRSNTHHMS